MEALSGKALLRAQRALRAVNSEIVVIVRPDPIDRGLELLLKLSRPYR